MCLFMTLCGVVVKTSAYIASARVFDEVKLVVNLFTKLPQFIGNGVGNFSLLDDLRLLPDDFRLHLCKTAQAVYNFKQSHIQPPICITS